MMCNHRAPCRDSHTQLRDERVQKRIYSILIVTTKLKTEMARPSDMHVIVMYVYKCLVMCEGRSGEKTHLSESEEGGGAREARALF